MKAVILYHCLANSTYVYIYIYIDGYLYLYGYTRIHVAFRIFVPTLSRNCDVSAFTEFGEQVISV